MARGAWWTEKNRKAKRRAAKTEPKPPPAGFMEITEHVKKHGLSAASPNPIRAWVPGRSLSATEVTSVVNLTDGHWAELNENGVWVRV